MSKKSLVYPIGHDPCLNMFYTYEEAVEFFGEPDEYELENDFLEIPEELKDRFLKAKEELYKASQQLGEIYAKNGKKMWD